MTILAHHRREGKKCTAPKTVVLREEFVALTQEPLVAIVLNQLLYWTQRVKDFDLFLQEERFVNPGCTVSPLHGWIYKTANDLIEETMICVDRTTMRRYLKILMDRGWLEERSHPKNKWEKTIQYRLNIRKLQEDLLPLGFELPGIDLLLKQEFVHKSNDEELVSDPFEVAETLMEDFAPSKGQNISLLEKAQEHSRVHNSPSKGYAAPSKEKIDPSNVTNSPLYIQRLQSEIINKDHTQDACVCEETCLKNFSDFENQQPPVSETSSSALSDQAELAENKTDPDSSELDESIAEEMIRLWEYHIVQTLFPKNWKGVIRLTKERENQLESIFAFHFRNDIRAWEQFCLKSKGIPFLMGESPSGWHVTLDWILEECNLIKILEGNFDGSHRMYKEESHEWSAHESGFLGGNLSKSQSDPSHNAQKDAILSSIKDPIWREWCTKLSQGVRLNELQMRHTPLSLAELNQIANARFLECEDERLVWIGSSDQAVLNAIEKIRLKINWVFADCYPKAHTIRTRLLKNSLPIQQEPRQSLSSSSNSAPSQGEQPHA